ncbi:hypothetical protein CMUS01_04626 [Colletotrichum musicola]|uniref:Uncharacterized protein n=1 Tax=Colletotrichum musicola TaxID=2175873 RepID=A0A8H6KWC0_9PEZI|nr:hypothetical protein CMUS01_04626 [Colletotrichum musicola]
MRTTTPSYKGALCVVVEHQDHDGAKVDGVGGGKAGRERRAARYQSSKRAERERRAARKEEGGRRKADSERSLGRPSSVKREETLEKGKALGKAKKKAQGTPKEWKYSVDVPPKKWILSHRDGPLQCPRHGQSSGSSTSCMPGPQCLVSALVRSFVKL